MEHTPWTEKYRPTTLDNVILDKYNRVILEKLICDDIPNMIFYGPPGTGKTTSAINLVKSYQQKNQSSGNEMILHLNASDERGVDTIRSQIQTFVKLRPLFGKGRKFVILDEIDYMTENAQLGLKHLMNHTSNDVCFILICNYISKLNISIRNSCMVFRFNSLPRDNIYNFLTNVLKQEQLQYSSSYIRFTIDRFGSDIRSMLNFLQLHITSVTHEQTERNYQEILDELTTVINNNKNTFEKLKDILSTYTEKLNISLKECACLITTLSTHKEKHNILLALTHGDELDEKLYAHLLSHIF